MTLDAPPLSSVRKISSAGNDVVSQIIRDQFYLTMANLVPFLNYYNGLLESNKNPLVDNWPMMESPVPIFLILGAYLTFVLKLGPKIMESRPAFQLKNVLIIYNGIQVIFSVWLCFKALQTHFLKFLFAEVSSQKGENNVNQMQLEISTYIWWYFFAKVTELLDTVFFVLRKKQNQVTFLHVYHHGVMAFGGWHYLKIIPGGQAIVLGFLNSFVHVVMYSYYLIAALGPNYQKYIWWKKYMTWMQLIQFGVIFCYLIFLLAVDSVMPKTVSYFFCAHAIIFVYMFGKFYVKTYKHKIA